MATFERCIFSVIEQTYPQVEFIVIDGQSTDGTQSVIDKYRGHIHHLVCEPDNGLYDAMNKGIALASGDVVGVLNADDYFADAGVLDKVAQAFASSGGDIVYGDIDYVDKQGKITRKWRSGNYKQGDFNLGWMPPHPSFYAKRALFGKLGTYRLQYGSATDYELMLRFIHTNKVKVHYINKVMVKMQVGGVSNKNIKNRVKAWRNDFKAMGDNGLMFPFISIMLKPLRKVYQYIG